MRHDRVRFLLASAFNQTYTLKRRLAQDHVFVFLNKSTEKIVTIDINKYDIDI